MKANPPTIQSLSDQCIDTHPATPPRFSISRSVPRVPSLEGRALITRHSPPSPHLDYWSYQSK